MGLAAIKFRKNGFYCIDRFFFHSLLRFQWTLWFLFPIGMRIAPMESEFRSRKVGNLVFISPFGRRQISDVRMIVLSDDELIGFQLKLCGEKSENTFFWIANTIGIIFWRLNGWLVSKYFHNVCTRSGIESGQKWLKAAANKFLLRMKTMWVSEKEVQSLTIVWNQVSASRVLATFVSLVIASKIVKH